MGLGPKEVQLDAWGGSGKGKAGRRKEKGEEAEVVGCWIKFRLIGSCIPSRSKVDSSISSASTHCESKSTNDGSKDQQAAPIVSGSTTTSNTESHSSTSKVGEELKVASQLRKFAFNELKSATRNFRPESLLGEGGFGCVFKGWIEENGTAPVKPGTGLTVAVKTLNHDGLQGHKEWLAEVNFLGDLQHPNLVKLIGYCIEDDQRLLVYEFMPRGSLENHLFRRSVPLPWSIRMKVALGAAKGLAFLHEEAERPVIYRDFKTSNILLDTDYNAKLSDFGLAKDGPEGDKTHVSTRVMGTYGYAAPEYLQFKKKKMSHIFRHPNHGHVESLCEERHSNYNHHRPSHHNHNGTDFREGYYASVVEAPAYYQATDCCAETVFGRPGYGNFHGDKVVNYVREEDVVVDNCVEHKHHGRYNRLGSF